MCSSRAANALAPTQRQQLLGVAADSIRAGLDGARLALRAEFFAEPLRTPRACFVTLELDASLRGCVGSLAACRALVEDVAHNAYRAAFEDPRFPALTDAEFERLDIHLSILSVPEAMTFSCEADLLAQLRPGEDGLVFEEGLLRATFLPQVWEQLPDARAFVQQLKRKAGLPPDYWSRTLAVKRYVVESFP